MHDILELRSAIALAAGLIMEWADDSFGFGGAAGDPDPEQISSLKEICNTLNEIVDEQGLQDNY